ncbi:small subunit ribosomal protein S25e [Nematocida sp. AWRm80]|nr:small subunit ribosomal protein S25e [Nematocida sp. AWRm80]
MAKKVDPKAQKKTTGKDKPSKKKDQKKWVKTTTKEKILKVATVDQELYNKIKKEVSTMVVITPSSIGSKNNLNVTVAKQILAQLASEGLIECLTKSAMGITYTKKEAPQPETKASVEEPVTA